MIIRKYKIDQLKRIITSKTAMEYISRLFGGEKVCATCCENY